MRNERKIRKLAETIAARFHPERIILFGSYAYGKPTRDSDVKGDCIYHYDGKEMVGVTVMHASRVTQREAKKLIKRGKKTSHAY